MVIGGNGRKRYPLSTSIEDAIEDYKSNDVEDTQEPEDAQEDNQESEDAQEDNQESEDQDVAHVDSLKDKYTSNELKAMLDENEIEADRRSEVKMIQALLDNGIKL